MKGLTFLCIAFLLFSGCTVFGYMIGSTVKQEQKLEELLPGEDIYILLTNGNKIEGSVNDVRNNNLYLTIEREEWAIPGNDVELIEVADIKWRFIGATIGIGMDIAIAGLIMSESPILGDSFRLSY
jgi:hypothetical protein